MQLLKSTKYVEAEMQLFLQSQNECNQSLEKDIGGAKVLNISLAISQKVMCKRNL